MNLRSGLSAWGVITGVTALAAILLYGLAWSRDKSVRAALVGQPPSFEHSVSGRLSVVSILAEYVPDAPAGGKPKISLADMAPRGSGFVVTADGDIVTCAHVVAGANRVLVRFAAGSGQDTLVPAQVIGVDAETDVALLHVDAKAPLPAVRWGDSTHLQLGQWVLAIGAPYGFEGTVTQGVVGALHRNLQAPGANPVRYIQSDVPEAPGNSGGPLLDLDGRVIGLNAQIFEADHGSSMPLSFAVPSADVIRVVSTLRDRAR